MYSYIYFFYKNIKGMNFENQLCPNNSQKRVKPLSIVYKTEMPQMARALRPSDLICY